MSNNNGLKAIACGLYFIAASIPRQPQPNTPSTGTGELIVAMISLFILVRFISLIMSKD